MKPSATFIAAGLFFLAGPALAAPVQFNTAVDLPKGTPLEVSATLSIKREGGTKAPAGYSRRWRQTVTGTQDGYRIEQQLLSPDPASLQAPEALAYGHGIAYLADASLRPVEILDWDRLRTLSLSALGKGQISDTLDFHKFFAEIDTREAADALLRGPSLLSIPQNMTLVLNEPHAYSSQVPMPVGGLTIKVNGTYTLTVVDKAKGEATIVWQEILDPVSTSQAVAKAVTTIMPKEELARLGDMKVERTLLCTFTMDIKSGLTREGTCEMGNKVSFSKSPETGGQTEYWTVSQRIIAK